MGSFSRSSLRKTVWSNNSLLLLCTLWSHPCTRPHSVMGTSALGWIDRWCHCGTDLSSVCHEGRGETRDTAVLCGFCQSGCRGGVWLVVRKQWVDLDPLSVGSRTWAFQTLLALGKGLRFIRLSWASSCGHPSWGLLTTV